MKDVSLKNELLNDIKTHLSYDRNTGLFLWLTNRGGKARAFTYAGYKDPDGYTRIQYNKKSWLAHHLAWFYIYGTLPDTDIDHINEIKTDNRPRNLRKVFGSIQNLNKSKPRADNKSTGLKGVTVNKQKHQERYVAAITLHGKRKYLGIFDTPEEAHSAYLVAKKDLLENYQGRKQ